MTLPKGISRGVGLGLAALLAAGPVRATDTIGGVAIGMAAAALIRSQAGNIDQMLDALTLRRGGAARHQTVVVPIYSIGRKVCVGAAQVTGPSDALKTVRICYEITGQIDGGKGRFGHIVPASSSNPLDFRRVQGVSVVAVIDASIWGNQGTFPLGGRKDAALLRAGAAVAAAKLAGPTLDPFFKRLAHIPSGIETKFVPILTVGEKSYVGMAQVMGANARGTDAVLQLEEVLGGKFKVRVFVPVDANLGLKRVSDVGVVTLIDMTLATGTTSPADTKKKPVPVVVPPAGSGSGGGSGAPVVGSPAGDWSSYCGWPHCPGTYDCTHPQHHRNVSGRGKGKGKNKDKGRGKHKHKHKHKHHGDDDDDD